MSVELEDKKFVEKNIELIDHIIARLKEWDITGTAHAPCTILLATVINRFEEKLDDVNGKLEELCGEVNSVGNEMPSLGNSISDLGSDIRAKSNKG